MESAVHVCQDMRQDVRINSQTEECKPFRDEADGRLQDFRRRLLRDITAHFGYRHYNVR